MIGKFQLKPVWPVLFNLPSYVKLYVKMADYAGACHRAALCADPLGSNPPFELSLGRPPNGRVLKLSPDHFLTQFFRTLADTDAGCKMMLVRPVRFRLLPNVFVISRDTLVRQFF